MDIAQHNNGKLKVLFWVLAVLAGFFIIMTVININIPQKDRAKYSLEDEVRGRMKDPSSARFSNETVYEWQKGSYALCGYVNAKNSFGGYTGDTRFVVSGGIVILENEDGAQGGMFQALYDKDCHNAY